MRGAELLERADKIRDNERRRKLANKKKVEKEAREREARRSMGVLSPDRVYISPRQERLFKWVKAGGVGEEVIPHDRVLGAGQESADCFGGGDLDDVLALMPSQILLEDSSPCAVRSPKRPAPNTERHRPAAARPPCEVIVQELESWDDVLPSSTQIEREISVPDGEPPTAPQITRRACKNNSDLEDEGSIPPLSTQDVSFSQDDLEELGIAGISKQILESQNSEEASTDHRPRNEQRQPDHEVKTEHLLSPKNPAITSSTKPLGITSAKERDRRLMPPPKLPVKALQSAALSLVDDIVASDFELSSQDCREICA